METECPNCGATDHKQIVVPDYVYVGAEVPVRHCDKCGEEWEDYRTFNARSEIWAEHHKNGRAV